MTCITGQQARGLLDIWRGDEDGLRHARGGAYARYGELFRAAPDLAETIAWLYGREADRVGGWTDLRYELGDGFRVDLRGDRVSVGTGRLSMHFSRDEAVDLARALLAAAQEARCEV